MGQKKKKSNPNYGARMESGRDEREERQSESDQKKKKGGKIIKRRENKKQMLRRDKRRPAQRGWAPGSGDNWISVCLGGDKTFPVRLFYPQMKHILLGRFEYGQDDAPAPTHGVSFPHVPRLCARLEAFGGRMWLFLLSAAWVTLGAVWGEVEQCDAPQSKERGCSDPRGDIVTPSRSQKP